MAALIRGTRCSTAGTGRAHGRSCGSAPPAAPTEPPAGSAAPPPSPACPPPCGSGWPASSPGCVSPGLSSAQPAPRHASSWLQIWISGKSPIPVTSPPSADILRRVYTFGAPPTPRRALRTPSS
uniref:Uncharacterized protein n=1 Tax=Arundo donax TaxID=35708 RepID=A0A0A9G0T8_ARUDO